MREMSGEGGAWGGGGGESGDEGGGKGKHENGDKGDNVSMDVFVSDKFKGLLYYI